MRAAVIKDGVVVNVIVVDSLDDTPPPGCDSMEEAPRHEKEMGWRRGENGVFRRPELPEQAKAPQ